MTRSKIKISHTRWSFEPDRNGPKSIFSFEYLRLRRFTPCHGLFSGLDIPHFFFCSGPTEVHTQSRPRALYTLVFSSSQPNRYTLIFLYLQQQSVVVRISCPPPLTHVQRCVLCTDVSERAVWPSVVRGGGASVASAPKSAPKR